MVVLNTSVLAEEAQKSRLSRTSIFKPFGVSGHETSDLPLWQRCGAVPLDFLWHLGAGSVAPAIYVGKSIYDKIPPGTLFNPIILVVVPSLITFAIALAIATILLVPRTIGTLGKALNDGANAIKEGAENAYNSCFGNS